MRWNQTVLGLLALGALASCTGVVGDLALDAGEGGGAGGGGAGGGGNGFTPGPAGCQALVVEPNVSLSGYATDRYGWSDASCARRTAALVRNTGADPGGSSGGYLRELTWSGGGTQRTARGTGSNGWNGWGYVVNHYGGTYDLSTDKTGTFRTVLAGAHHAIHEFKLRMSPGGPVDVTVRWFFATGRSAPVYAITFDASPAGPNAVRADTRAPYGDLAFEGTAGDIGGLGWGDRYRFVTTGAGPATFASTWDYTQPNVVPYVQTWSQSVDAEMGAVQTQSFEQHVAGGDYGYGLLGSDCWGKTDATRGPQCASAGQTMPTDWLWPFQLNQYELPSTTRSHRLAWGSSFGAIGQQSVTAFGKTFSGYPQVSYSVHVVVDPRSAQPTLAQAAAVERTLLGALTASEGTVVTRGPAGVGRTDTAISAPAGYSPLYGTWELAAASGRVTATLDPRGGALTAPVLHVLGFTASQPSAVTVDGVALAASSYFASVDAARQELWLTLNGTVSAPVVLHVE